MMPVKTTMKSRWLLECKALTSCYRCLHEPSSNFWMNYHSGGGFFHVLWPGSDKGSSASLTVEKGISNCHRLWAETWICFIHQRWASSASNPSRVRVTNDDDEPAASVPSEELLDDEAEIGIFLCFAQSDGSPFNGSHWFNFPQWIMQMSGKSLQVHSAQWNIFANAITNISTLKIGFSSLKMFHCAITSYCTLFIRCNEKGT